ncbi:hypothetical protein EYC80_009480 [Monilinia laxa]|uniref:Uncharacterized protein n=1 Tax=Monilinia laxa TaxID=61186 RepID=A0A5N6JXY4_MONLA|nr:hypothetical protein EYC80_009480 [Monilinia laxa]
MNLGGFDALLYFFRSVVYWLGLAFDLGGSRFTSFTSFTSFIYMYKHGYYFPLVVPTYPCSYSSLLL